MSTLAQSAVQAKAARVVVLPPSAFADDWSQKPTTDVAVGLRRLSERDLKVAAGEARKVIARDHVREGRVVDQELTWEAYNNELVRYAMARAMVDVNDHTQTYFKNAEDTIHVAMTTAGLQKVWDEYVLLAATGPASPKADDEQIARLGRALAKEGVLGSMPRPRELEIRKLLAVVLEQLGELVDVQEDEDDVYRVTVAAE